MKSKTEMTGHRRRVFLVDQFPIVRAAVSEWLERTPDLTLCGQADCVTSGLAGIRRLKPDVVVTEILCQQDLGFIKVLHRRHPRLPILVFSFRDEGWYAPRALEAGADGYLMKGVSMDRLVSGIRAASQGQVVLSPEMKTHPLVKCLSRRRPGPAAHGRRRSHRPCRQSRLFSC